MLKELNDYDWKEAFGFAGEPDTWAMESEVSIRGAYPGWAYDTRPFTREDVSSIGGMREGENDEDEWMIYGQLADGRWFYLVAGCDYTGWDCRAGGEAVVAASFDGLKRFGMTTEARAVFGLQLPEEHGMEWMSDG